MPRRGGEEAWRRPWEGRGCWYGVQEERSEDLHASVKVFEGNRGERGTRGHTSRVMTRDARRSVESMGAW